MCFHKSNAISFFILDEAFFNNKAKWFRMLWEACQNWQMMHLNIWGFNISISKLSFITKKLHQIKFLLCDFHNNPCCSLTLKYTSLKVVGKSLSHFYWCTLSTFEKLWDQEGIMFTSMKTLSTPLTLSMTQILSLAIAKLQIARKHTWTLNLKMPLCLSIHMTRI